MRFDPKLPDDRVNVSLQHPLRDAAFLVAGVCGLAVVVVLAISLAIDLLVPYIPPAVELRFFSLVDLEDDADRAETEDPRASRVQVLLERLAMHWPDNPYAFRAHVVDESEPNAFAVPGGRIVITRGLLDSVSSESELAFVLGHEIGHFKQRDHLRGLGRGMALGMAIAALDLGGAGGALDLLSGATGIADRHFDRNQESGADEIGLELVWREYGHVSGALEFFEHFPRPTGRLEEQFQSYLATHPLHSDRIESLNGMADARGWRRDGMAPALQLSD
jgi:Zn-dependent protease with chaperone function